MPGSHSQIVGCTSTSALNYNSNATFNNFSACIFPAYGCLDSTASNYDSTANTAYPASSGVSNGGCFYEVHAPRACHKSQI
eukprot:6214395-Pleurochrysis_carterae.AAC.1